MNSRNVASDEINYMHEFDTNSSRWNDGGGGFLCSDQHPVAYIWVPRGGIAENESKSQNIPDIFIGYIESISQTHKSALAE